MTSASSQQLNRTAVLIERMLAGIDVGVRLNLQRRAPARIVPVYLPGKIDKFAALASGAGLFDGDCRTPRGRIVSVV
jgi:hypothetical protein